MEMLVHMLMCEIMGLYIDKSVRIVRLHLHEPVEFENTYEKPIYLVKLFSVFMLADFCTGILYKMNLLEIINLEKIQADKVLSATFCTLVACFVIKVLLGACGKKIFLGYGNYLVYNKEDISNTV